MKKYIKTLLLGWLACANIQAQKPVFQNYEYEDQAIIQGMSDNGKWAVACGGEASEARLINLDTKETKSISSAEKAEKAYDVSNDGTMIVGHVHSVPSYYNATTDKWQSLEVRSPYIYGNAVSISSDGKWAVGTLYYGEGLTSIPALWDLSTGKLVSLTGLPKKDMSHQDQGQMDFRQISSDGNIILGCMSYSYLPSGNDMGGCFYFVYNRAEASYKPIGFIPSTTTRWTPLCENMLVIMTATMSNNGAYVTGSAHVARDIEGEDYADEYKIPFLYDVQNNQFTGFDEVAVSDTYGSAVSNDGAIIDVTPEATPVREWSVRTGNYWFSFAEILQQKYGTTIKDATTYDNTGTVNGISDDGKRLVSFPDPYCSYVVDLPEPVSKIGEGIKLLGTFNVQPAPGSEVSSLKNIKLTFDRNIKALGASTTAQLLDNQGKVVYNSVGFTAEGKVLSIRFRKGTLAEGQHYTLFIPAGSVAMENDESQTNSDIRISYSGRADVAVKMVSAYPAEGTAFSHIDYSTSPVMLTFDTEIAITDTAYAKLYRNDEKEAFCSLTLAKNDKRLALYPSTLQYLFDGSTYRVEVSEGAVTDVAGNNPNKAININYLGNYVREISANDTILFSSNFDNGLGDFMQWCGDQNAPTSEMVNWDFQQGMAWGLVRDDEASDDRMATSHSMYSPAGQSDDWLVIPQMYIPDMLCSLQFLSQSYLSSKKDVLKVVAWESNNVYNTLSKDIIDQMKAEGVVILEEIQSPGAKDEVLAGDWRHNHISLAQFAEKNIYIAFVNQNHNQSAIFMDSLMVRHDMNYLTALEYEESVVNQECVKIKGTLVGNNKKKSYETATVTLKNVEGKTITSYHANDLNLAYGKRHRFEFDAPLPLTLGQENLFSVHTNVDGEENEIRASIKNLAFQPQKRVVLEEYTGRSCGNCPLGILAFEKLQERYGDSFIPISIHTYNNDPLSTGLSNYTSLLGIDQLGAPSGTVNRGTGCYPAASAEIDGVARYFFSQTEDASIEDKLWADHVADEIASPAECDIQITQLTYDEATGSMKAKCEMRYALNAENQTVNLFTVLLEDNLKQAQQNYMSSISSPDLGEWGLGGIYGQSVVQGYLHQDVARNVSGLTINGTGGHLPSTVEAGKVYEAEVEVAVPSNVQSLAQCKVVVMMINANTGKVINAGISKYASSTGIHDMESAEDAGQDRNTLYNVMGQRIGQNFKGIIIRNGKKYLQK